MADAAGRRPAAARRPATAPPVALDGGRARDRHRARRRQPALDIDQLVLRSAAGGGATPAASGTLVERGRGRRGLAAGPRRRGDDEATTAHRRGHRGHARRAVLARAGAEPQPGVDGHRRRRVAGRAGAGRRVRQRLAGHAGRRVVHGRHALRAPAPGRPRHRGVAGRRARPAWSWPSAGPARWSTPPRRWPSPTRRCWPSATTARCPAAAPPCGPGWASACSAWCWPGRWWASVIGLAAGHRRPPRDLPALPAAGQPGRARPCAPCTCSTSRPAGRRRPASTGRSRCAAPHPIGWLAVLLLVADVDRRPGVAGSRRHGLTRRAHRADARERCRRVHPRRRPRRRVRRLHGRPARGGRRAHRRRPRLAAPRALVGLPRVGPVGRPVRGAPPGGGAGAPHLPHHAGHARARPRRCGGCPTPACGSASSPTGCTSTGATPPRWPTPSTGSTRTGIPYRDLCFLGAKPQVEADCYVEDAPHNVARPARARVPT